MRWGVVVGVVVVAAAAAFYLLAVPGMLSSSYEERAEPEHEKAEKALDPAYEAFSRETLGTDNRPIEKADKPGEYVREIERVTADNLRRLSRARRTVKRAEAGLGEVDEGELGDVPDWPLLGGRGGLDEAEEIAGDEGDYLRKARAFLRDFRRLIDFETDFNRFWRRVGLTIGRGNAAIPKNPTSPGQVTRPVDRSVRQLESALRRFRRMKAPPERRAEHRNVVAGFGFVIAELRRFSSAIKRLDIGAAEQVDKRLARGTKRYDRRTQANFRRLIARSRYVRQIDDLERRERELGRAWDEL